MTNRKLGLGFVEPSSNFLKATLWIALLLQLVLVLFTRPSFDDYGYLAFLSDSSILNYASDFWHSWGGNLTTVVITGIFLKFALITNVWVAYAIFGVVSTSLISLALYSGLSLFTPDMAQGQKKYLSILIASVGISNFAFPAHLASISFTTAAIAHLWPICIFMILLQTLTKKRFPFILLVVVGILLTNPNIAEGSAIFGFTLIHQLGMNTKFLTSLRKSLPITQNLFPLLAGQSVGLLLIVVAPGFTSRITIVEQGNVEHQSRLSSFQSAFVDFFAVLFTTPSFMMSVISLLFLVLQFRQNKGLILALLGKVRVLLILLISLLSMLILGSTFAYAAWHQSLGLIFMATLLAIVLIYEVNLRFNFTNNSKFFFFLVIVVIFMFDVISGINRGVSWDRAYKYNMCLIQQGSTEGLVGSELQNPISKLGFEDVETWDWVRHDYVLWLNQTSDKSRCS